MEATGFQYGNLRQATTRKLVLTCHESIAVVQCRLCARMAVHGDVVLRQRICLGSDCRALFFLCQHCDRGQRYCSVSCREQARLEQRRCANRRHQQSPEGRLDHRDRQREYRQRRAQRRVTDQGSVSLTCSASSRGGPREAIAEDVPHRGGMPLLPLTSNISPRLWLCCRRCGRRGRFVDPLSRTPPRR